MSGRVLDIVLFAVGVALVVLIAFVSTRAYERRSREHSEAIKEMYRRSGLGPLGTKLTPDDE